MEAKLGEFSLETNQVYLENEIHGWHNKTLYQKESKS